MKCINLHRSPDSISILVVPQIPVSLLGLPEITEPQSPVPISAAVAASSPVVAMPRLFAGEVSMHWASSRR